MEHHQRRLHELMAPLVQKRRRTLMGLHLSATHQPAVLYEEIQSNLRSRNGMHRGSSSVLFPDTLDGFVRLQWNLEISGLLQAREIARSRSGTWRLELSKSHSLDTSALYEDWLFHRGIRISSHVVRTRWSNVGISKQTRSSDITTAI